MTTIYIIRHGEAEGNLYKIAQGHYNSNLTKTGVAQLELLKERFREIPVDAAYSSDLNRAFLTAKSIADLNNISVIKTDRLREVNLGDFENKPWAALLDINPKLYKEWQSDPHTFVFPNGESAKITQDRIYKKVMEIVDTNRGKTVVIGCHGDAIRYFLHKVLNIPLDNSSDIGHSDNTAISKILVDNDNNITVEFKNDSSHLENFDYPFIKRGWWEVSDLGMLNLNYRPVDFQNDDISMFSSSNIKDTISAFATQNNRKIALLSCKINHNICEIICIDVLNDIDFAEFFPQYIGYFVTKARENNCDLLKYVISDTNTLLANLLDKIGFTTLDNITFEFDITR